MYRTVQITMNRMVQKSRESASAIKKRPGQKARALSKRRFGWQSVRLRRLRDELGEVLEGSSGLFAITCCQQVQHQATKCRKLQPRS